jgi:hypothetical protein
MAIILNPAVRRSFFSLCYDLQGLFTYLTFSFLMNSRRRITGGFKVTLKPHPIFALPSLPAHRCILNHLQISHALFAIYSKLQAGYL